MHIERNACRNCNEDSEHQENAIGHIPSKDDAKGRLDAKQYISLSLTHHRCKEYVIFNTSDRLAFPLNGPSVKRVSL